MRIKVRETEDGSPEHLSTLIIGEMEAMKGARRVYVMENIRHMANIGGYIQDARDLLPADKDFGAWLKDNFNWSQQQAYRLRDAGKVAAAFISGHTKKQKFGVTSLPTNEGQLREIARVTTEPKEVIELWERIEPGLPRDSEGNIKSAASIRKAIQDTPEPTPKRKPKAPDFKTLAKQIDKVAELVLNEDLEIDDLPQSFVDAVYKLESILNN